MKHLLKCTAILAVLTLFSSCKKEWNELGSQLIVQEDLVLLSLDSMAIKTTIHKEDSLVTLNASTSHIGEINESNFGLSNASLYTEFRLSSSDVEFGEFAVADSLVLSFDVKSIYGDTLSALDFSVVEMLEQIETSQTDSLGEESTVSIYSSDEFATDNIVLGTATHDLAIMGEEHINIHLSNEFAQHFLDADNSNFVDSDVFQEFFNGLYITCGTTSEGALLELDLLSESSKLTLYYHTNDSDSLTYDFQINSNADRMTHWSNDYTATAIEDAFGEQELTRAYIQGGVGIRTYLELPELSSLKDSNYVVHIAELEIPYIDIEGDFTTPDKLGLSAINAQGELEELVEDQNFQGSVYFDGNRNELTQMYKFNIARYIHKVIEEGYTNRLALYVPNSIVKPERVIINNNLNEGGAVRLNLFVSQQ
jgi:hypothetical protein